MKVMEHPCSSLPSFGRFTRACTCCSGPREFTWPKIWPCMCLYSSPEQHMGIHTSVYMRGRHLGKSHGHIHGRVNNDKSPRWPTIGSHSHPHKRIHGHVDFLVEFSLCSERHMGTHMPICLSMCSTVKCRNDAPTCPCVYLSILQ